MFEWQEFIWRQNKIQIVLVVFLKDTLRNQLNTVFYNWTLELPFLGWKISGTIAI